MIGSVGDIVFEVSSSRIRTFRGYTDGGAARVSMHEVGGARPVGEFVGPGTREISIPVQLNAALGVDVEADIAKAQGYRDNGTLLTVTIGGKPVGGAGARWILENSEVDRTHFDRSGSAVLANMSLELKLARTSETPLPISQVIEKQNVQRVKA